MVSKPAVNDPYGLKGSNFCHVYFDYFRGAALISSRKADQVEFVNFLKLSDPTFEHFVHFGVPSIHLQTTVSRLLAFVPDFKQGVKRLGHPFLEVPPTDH